MNDSIWFQEKRYQWCCINTETKPRKLSRKKETFVYGTCWFGKIIWQNTNAVVLVVHENKQRCQSDKFKSQKAHMKKLQQKSGLEGSRQEVSPCKYWANIHQFLTVIKLLMRFQKRFWFQLKAIEFVCIFCCHQSRGFISFDNYTYCIPK